MNKLVVVGIVALLTGSAAQLNAKSELPWGPAPASLPPGAKLKVVSGDPAKPGPFVILLRLPPGYEIHPHHQASTAQVKVVYGALSYGVGSKFDPTQFNVLGRGKSFVAPANTNQYLSTTQGATVRISSNGPLQITYANPRHDPRNQN